MNVSAVHAQSTSQRSIFMNQQNSPPTGESKKRGDWGHFSLQFCLKIIENEKKKSFKINPLVGREKLGGLAEEEIIIRIYYKKRIYF